MSMLGFVSTVAVVGLFFILLLGGGMGGMGGWILLLFPLIILGSIKILALFMIPAYAMLFLLTKKRLVYGIIWACASSFLAYYYFAHGNVSFHGRDVVVPAIILSLSVMIIMFGAVAARNDINLDADKSSDALSE